MALRFEDKDFTPTRYDTAHDKALALTQLARFLANGRPAKGFTKRAYDLLYLHCFGHIAHYSRSGFYAEWFNTPQRAARWVEYARRGGAYGFHRIDDDTWGDVERALVAWLDESGVGERIIAEASSETERAERALLAELQRKYA